MKELVEVLKDWEAVIGLEIHTELTTLKTKMFCSCSIEFGDEPNTHTCPVCLGMPGALPVPNRAAIESIILAGLATGCDIERRSMFYRKNYFYPDMAKNFQTTQGPIAFCMRGSLDLEVEERAAVQRYGALELKEGQTNENITRTDYGYLAKVGITRIHMEEDAGKMIHIGGTDGRISGATHSLVDYNRAGTPLIELVTEPDLRTPEEARLFMQELRSIFLSLGISDCSMEEGSMRCDGNVSLRRRGESEFGTKTELKNMNSFKNLHDGLAYEICRQAEVLESGGVVRQETRHWEPASKRTVTMRIKETADDYRLFPEPDLAPYDLSEEFVEDVRKKLPELPKQRKDRYMSTYGLGRNESITISSDPDTSRLFDEAVVIDASLAKTLANLLVNDLAGYLNTNGVELKDTKVNAQGIVDVAKLISSDEISAKQGRDVLAILAQEGTDVAKIVESHGMKQLSDEGMIIEAVKKVLEQNPDKVEAYKNGKTGLSGFFIGQVMKATGGSANPKVVSKVVSDLLD